MERIDKVFIENNFDHIIPSGNGGINGEGRTLKEICAKPVPEHLIKKLDEERLAPGVVSRMKADLARMGSNRVPHPAQNGHVDFSAIAWHGVSVRLPEGWTDCSYLSELSWH